MGQVRFRGRAMVANVAKKNQDAFLEFLKKKRMEVSRQQKIEAREYDSPIPFTFGEKERKERSWFSLGGILVGGIVLLIALNGVTLVLLLRERTRSMELAALVSHAEKELSYIAEEVPRQTMRNTQESLAETQKKLRSAVADGRGSPQRDVAPERKAITPLAVAGVTNEPPPTPPAAAPAEQPSVPPAPAAAPPPEPPPAASPPAKRIADFSVPSGKVLFPYVHMDAGEQMLLVDKSSRTLFHLRSVEGKLRLEKAYACIVGKNIKDKEKNGDLATPEGVYFFVEFVPGSKLPQNYGMGAFVLNYPDFLDKKDGKTGNGVWLHGHDPAKKLDEVQSTKGCVVVDNEVMRELSTVIKLGITPIVIVDALAFRSADSQKKVAEELTSLLTGWQKSWEAVDMKKYLQYYSRDFRGDDGSDLESFGRRKEQVSKSKKFIQLRLDRKALLLSQKEQGDIAVVRFRQSYRSNNFNGVSVKSLYLKKSEKGWHIVRESTLAS